MQPEKNFSIPELKVLDYFTRFSAFRKSFSGKMFYNNLMKTNTATTGGVFMMMKKMAVGGIIGLMLMNCFADWKTEKQGEDAIVLYNDAEDAVKNGRMKVLPLIGGNVWMSKTFDLTQLPEEWRGQIGSAALRIYMQAADQSVAVRKIPRNGLTEQLKILVNGHEMILNTSDSRFPSVKRWTDIAIPAEWVKGDKLDVKIHKVESKTNDDFVYMGVDTSSEPGFSKVSVNGGNSFQFESRFLAGLKGEYMIRLVLYRTQQEVSVDFSKKKDISQVELKDGAVIKDQAAVFDGMKSAAVLRDSEGLNVTEKGLTISGVVRMEPCAAKKDHNMLMACKKGAWFIGRTGNRVNFSFSTNNGGWNNAVWGGEYPELGEYFHFAAVFQYVNEHAQGNVGYLCSVYLNGELAGQKMFFYIKPSPSKYPVIIGNGNVEGHAFSGSIASIRILSRALNAGEIAELVRTSGRLSALPAGFFASTPDLKKQLESAAKIAKHKETVWIVNSLKRAAETGYDQNRMKEILQKTANVIASGKKGKELADFWNRECPEIQLISSSKGLLMIAAGQNRTNSPVIGFYNSMTGTDVLDGRGTGWTLNFDGRQYHDRSSGVSYTVSPVKTEADGGAFQVVWTKPGDFSCISDFTFTGSRLEQTLEVKNLNKANILSSVDFPRFFIRKLPGGNDQLAYPRFIGILAPNPAVGFGESALYPTANCTMQFCAYFDQKQNGVYAAFEAVDGAVKTQSVVGRNGIVEYKWINPVAVPGGGNGFKTSGPAVLETYQGDWFEAGQIYKKFADSKPPWRVKELPRRDTTAWYHNNTFWIASSPNYIRSLAYLRNYFELPYAVWLCAWEDRQESDCENMVIIPTEYARNAVRELIPQGVYLQSYINARLWGYIQRVRKSDISDSATVKKYGARQRNGKAYKEDYGEGVPFSVMCTATEFWQKQLVVMAGYSAKNGFNGIYWDQLPCSSPRICWSSEHGHAPGDPTAWVRGYRTMLKNLRAKYPQMALDGEDHSEVYNDVLDGYMTWRSTEPNHIPMFQSVYGGGRVQFTARAFDTFGGKSGSYEASFAKLGEQFTCGEQLGWMHMYDIRHGDPRRLYAKKLMHLRKALLGYFNEADMLRPLSFSQPVPKLKCLWGNSRSVQTSDKVASAAWKRLRDGRILLLFTNTVDETITVHPTTRYPGMTKLAICAEGEKEVRYVDLEQEENPEVTLAPYTSCIWLLGKDYDRNEAETIAETTCRIASFTDAGKSIPGSAPQFKVSRKLQAKSGKWITPQDSSWLLFAFKESNPSVEFQPNGPAEYRSNWIRASKGAVISYGEVDFGSKAPRELEIELASSAENAGGEVKLYDITGDNQPDSVLAEITTENTGGWLKWKTFRVPMKNVTGKRQIVIRVDGRDCNIRSWRILN